ncbi:MAG TPA: hypothetical protein VKR82_14885 [Candidatus Acidoferrales bacterium]|nr:hypothetical protein [Candidatus Acidoferrales bacterium]
MTASVGFSGSHFVGEAGPWLAAFVSDLVNTEIRMLLRFMSQAGSGYCVR